MIRSGKLCSQIIRVSLRHFCSLQLSSWLALLSVITIAGDSLYGQSFAESWNRDGQDEAIPGTAGSALTELRNRNAGRPVSDRFLQDHTLATQLGGDEYEPLHSNSEYEDDSAEHPADFTNSLGLIRKTSFLDNSDPADNTRFAPRPYEDTELSTAFRDSNDLLNEAPQARQATSPAQLFRNPAPQEDSWQVLPTGLLYRTYLAGPKEPRLQYLSLYDTKNHRRVSDATLGGRVGLLRKGSGNPNDLDGFQLDIDGAVFARVLPNEPSTMLEGSDYRVGLAGTWRQDRLAWKFGYCHISSHIGDEFLLAYPTTVRKNYVRDSVIAGISYDMLTASRVYAEVGYALGISGGAEPMEMQLGTEWTPTAKGRRGAPFAAFNAQFREEQGSNAGLNMGTGWGWEGTQTRHRVRVGANYYNGPALQYSFADRRENLVGGGIWLDF
ncbi:MAG: DUF1207 domain-containing protein [Planctomycetia bacterium]